MVLKDLESGMQGVGKGIKGRNYFYFIGIITEMLEAFYNDEFHRYNVDEL